LVGGNLRREVQAPLFLDQHQKKSHLRVTVWILAVVFVILLSFCGLGSFFFVKRFGYRNDATGYTRRLLLSPAFSTWDPEALLKEASPEYYDHRDPAHIRKVTVDLFRKEAKYYGTLVRIGNPSSFAYTSPTATSGSGKPIASFDAIANTNTQVTYQNAKANIYLNLVLRKGTWRVAQFRITQIK
jgi:hypothetical protein